MTKRPNFILLITDQHRADFLGCYGHPILKTPNIDRLADQGVAYDKFYVASPVCMPNRASLMTCRMPSSHGVRGNGIPLDRRNVSFVEVLAAAGYDTALIGKSHLQNFAGLPPKVRSGPARPGFVKIGGDLDQAIRSDHEDPFYEMESPNFWHSGGARLATPFHGFGHVELVTEHGDAVGGDYVGWLKERAPHVLNMMGPENQLEHDYVCPQAVRTAVPEEYYSTSYIAERAVAWLEARRESDRPFFLMVSWPDPHHPFNPPGKYWDMYSADDMEVPTAFRANNWTPPLHVELAEKARADGTAPLKGMGTIACSPREAQEARALTCGMIAMIDDAVGRICSAAGDPDAGAGTVRIFTTDHGDHLGDHRLLLKGAEQYEATTRVPFIWSDPDGRRGARSDGLGQTIDIGTTILERARIEAPEGMQGQALAVAGGKDRALAFIQYDHQKPDPITGGPPRVHTIHDGRWRMSLFAGSNYGELFDLSTDPHELNNIWEEPAAVAEKNRLLLELVKLEIENVDQVPLPTGMA